MTKLKIHIYILFLCCSFNLTVLASNFVEEENFVASFADTAISILSNDSLSDTERTSSFTELVMSSIDLNLISKFVLSKAWKNASDEQKEAYLIAFKDYFVSSYANKLDQYAGEKVDVVGSQEAGKYVIVESNIIREGTDTLKINLKWRLLNKDNKIKIIDLNIEGISLVIAQREEFQSFLANNDYDLDKLIEKIVSVSD